MSTCQQDAEHLRCHKDRKLAGKDDGVLRHTANGCRWKARNVVVGVSTDGINPFGNQRSTHKTLPIFVWFYTLPPWLYMKRKYIQIVMIFQGPTQPGNGINLYLKLLKEELLTLWVVKGVKT